MIPKTKYIKSSILIALLLVLTVYFFPNQAQANVPEPIKFILDATGGALMAPINAILIIFKEALARILLYIVSPLVSVVMSYNNFFTDGVNLGWKVTRDFANLFFALILLLIAIATVLNIGPLDNYTAKRILPNFIMVALFINFSKAIVGFLIDISQIIMIELWNAIGGGDSFKDVIMKTANINQSGISNVQALVSGVEGVAMNLVIIVLLALLIFIFLWTIVILIVRIANFWIAIMLAPLAFMSFLIPGLRELYNTWIKLLQGALVTGPVLMFMLYLSVTVMSSGFPTIPEDGNLLYDGNMLTYILVAILLFASNAIATKAGMEAPPLLQKAVGVAGSIASLGVGAKIGAGGTGLRQGLKDGWDATGGKVVSGVDGAISGTARGVQLLSGGKIKANSRYESFKKDMVARNDSGNGLLGGIGQQFSKEGREEQQKDYDKARANELYASGKLDDKANERYKKIFDSNQATAATDIKGVENVDKLIEDLDQALKDGDKAMAMALSSRISELKGWGKVFSENSEFGKYGKDYASEGEQLTAFIKDKFGKDNNGNEMQDNKILNEFKSRQVSILRSKGAENFAVGLTPETQGSPTGKAAKAGLIGAGAMYAKNNSIFNTRSKAADRSFAFDNGKAKYEFDINEFAPVIGGESSRDTLENPKSWNQYSDIKNSIIQGIEEYLQADTATRQKPKYDKISKIDDDKLKSALKGLGGKASSRVTGGTI
ncbi:MAG: hypothetical protein RLZZ223_485 [Candidatus Parcubacteria bacterium]